MGYYVSSALFKSRRIPGGLRYGIMVVLLLILVIPLYQRVGHWSLPSRFFMNEIKNHPESARNIGGLAYQQVGVKLYPQAVVSYQRAAALAPQEMGYSIAGLNTIVFKMHEPPSQDMVDTVEKSLGSHKISHYAAIQLFTLASDSLSLPEDSPLANRPMVERLLKAAAANPHPWPTESYLGTAMFHLAEILFRQNRLEEAAVALEKVAVIIPEKYDARLGLARIYLTHNKIEEAEKQIKWLESRRLDKDRMMILSRLRQELMQRNRS